MSSLAFAYVRVPVKNLLNVVNPFEKPPWYCRPFTIEEVWKAVDEERFQEGPTPNWYSIDDHIERIAYFVSEGWDEDDYTPEFVVSEEDWPLGDGNHRFAAAVVRGDELIKILIDGDLTIAEERLGIKIPDSLRFCED